MTPERIQVVLFMFLAGLAKGSNYMVHLKCKGRYGYEYIMKEVAKHFNTKVCSIFLQNRILYVSYSCSCNIFEAKNFLKHF